MEDVGYQEWPASTATWCSGGSVGPCPHSLRVLGESLPVAEMTGIHQSLSPLPYHTVMASSCLAGGLADLPSCETACHRGGISVGLTEDQ